MTELEKEIKTHRKEIAEIRQILKETATESKKRMAEAEAEREKRAAKADAEREKRMAEQDESIRKEAAERKKRMAEFDLVMKRIQQNIGGFTDAVGEALEDEFFAALDESRRVGDILLTEVQKGVTNFRGDAEYDLVGVNGKFILVGEIKHSLDGHDVRHFAENQLPRFARDFPGEAKGRKILGMVGGNRISAKAREEAEKRGLIILRLRHKKLVVENEKNARPAP